MRFVELHHEEREIKCARENQFLPKPGPEISLKKIQKKIRIHQLQTLLGMRFFPLTNDLVFKSLFVQDPNLLASLVSSVLYPDGEHQIKEVTILNPELPIDFIGDKRSYLDIKARDETGSIFHVEVQVAHQSSFVQRSLYYLSGLIRDQLKSGESYSNLKPVYQINILDFNLIQLENFHTRFKFREEENREVTLTDELEIHFLELPKVPKDETLKLLKNGNDLYLWMYVLKNAQILGEEEMDIVVQRKPDLKNAFAILERYSSDPEKRRQIEEKIKADRDYAYDLAGSFEDGFKKGKIEDARMMQQEGISDDVICRVTGLNKNDLKEHGII